MRNGMCWGRKFTHFYSLFSSGHMVITKFNSGKIENKNTEISSSTSFPLLIEDVQS